MVQFFERKGATYWEWALKEAATQFPPDNVILKYIEHKGMESNSESSNYGMYGAAEAGNTELVHYFIEKGAEKFSKGLWYAAQGGSMDLVKFFLAKMNQPDERNLLRAIEAAAGGGHLEILTFLTELSKDEKKYCHWWSAARFNQKHILEYVRTQHEMCQRCMRIALPEAAYGNHLSLLQELFKCNNGKVNSFWKRVYVAAARKGNTVLMKFAWDQEDTDLVGTPNTWIGRALLAAAKYKQKEIMKLLLPQYEWETSPESIGMVLSSAENGWRDILDLITEHAKDKLGGRHFSSGVTGAVQGGHMDILEYFIKLLKPRKYEPDSGLYLAAKHGRWNLVDYFLQQGATNLDEASCAAWNAGYEDLHEYLSEKMKQSKSKGKKRKRNRKS